MNAAALLVGGHRALLCRRGEVWDIPSEPLQDDEYPLDTLVRLLSRSLRVRLTEVDANPLGTDIPVQRGTSDPVPLRIWAVRRWRGDPSPGMSDAYDAADWFRLHQALDLHLAHPAYPSLLSTALTVPDPAATIVRRTRRP